MSKEKKQEFKVSDYGAKSDGRFLCTSSIQHTIDRAAASGGGVVTFTKGIYLTGAIFLKSNVEMVINEGVEIRGVIDEDAYPSIWSRVAGIEMDWPSGLINVCGQNHVKITGGGLINGQGEYWWNKYWGEDKLGGMRKDYTAKGLRWAVDYDCERPRNIIVLNSSEVVLEKFNSLSILECTYMLFR
jgi:polygalacturonase